MGKCLYCQESVRIFKKICPDCQEMLQVLQQLGPSFSFRDLLDALMETKASNEKIQRFLEADIQGQGSIRDMITARMTNELAHRMGQPTDMVAQKVKVIREAEQKNPTPNDLPGEINPYRR